MKVKKTTRTGKWGKIIICPECDHRARVYHFSWVGLECKECNTMTKKLDWILKNNRSKR